MYSDGSPVSSCTLLSAALTCDVTGYLQGVADALGMLVARGSRAQPAIANDRSPYCVNMFLMPISCEGSLVFSHHLVGMN